MSLLFSIIIVIVIVLVIGVDVVVVVGVVSPGICVVVVDVYIVTIKDLYSPLTSITSSVVPRMFVAWHLYTP